MVHVMSYATKSFDHKKVVRNFDNFNWWSKFVMRKIFVNANNRQNTHS